MTDVRSVDAPDWSKGPLLPAVVQDAADGRVLMLGWMDEAAWQATLATGEVHFHSRSRARLWRKGETSGNVLRLRALDVDCDRDAVLVRVEPVGPTCHRGTRSCFDPLGPLGSDMDRSTAPPVRTSEAPGFGWLDALWSTIESRAALRPEGSYTAGLLAGGVDAVARKVVEEATEVVLAAKDHANASELGRDRAAAAAALGGEAADLLFHLLVLLAERGMPPGAVLDVLRARSSPATARAVATDPPAAAGG